MSAPLTRVFTMDDQRAFARLSGDCNPLHVDAVRARRLLFGGPVIHSFTAAMTFGAVLVGSYTSIFIAAPLLIYLGVGQGRELADDNEPSATTEVSKNPAKR